MRTTIDIPDDLLRRTKSAAALRGLKLKDLVALLLDKGLRNLSVEGAPEARGQRRPIPVSVSLPGVKILATNEEIEGIFLREDLERLVLS